MTILISACLLGINCRYDGGQNIQPEWLKVLNGHHLIPICPEQLGGLSTPRAPAEITGGFQQRVLTRDGLDVTEAFVKGASESLKLAELLGADCAVLKERSPSCGVNHIYDGSFNNEIIPGMGFTAAALKEAGLTVYSEEELDRFIMDQA